MSYSAGPRTYAFLFFSSEKCFRYKTMILLWLHAKSFHWKAFYSWASTHKPVPNYLGDTFCSFTVPKWVFSHAESGKSDWGSRLQWAWGRADSQKMEKPNQKWASVSNQTGTAFKFLGGSKQWHLRGTVTTALGVLLELLNSARLRWETNTLEQFLKERGFVSSY